MAKNGEDQHGLQTTNWGLTFQDVQTEKYFLDFSKL